MENEIMIPLSAVFEMFEMEIKIDVPGVNYEEKTKEDCYLAGISDGGAATRMFFLMELKDKFSPKEWEQA